MSSSPQVQAFVQSGDPTSTSVPGGQPTPVLSGKNGDLLVSEAHGKWYSAGYNGKTFIAANTSAAIPLYGTVTSLTGIILYNPYGSGKNVELISLLLANAGNGTMVISSFRWAVYTGIGGGGQALPTLQVSSANIFANPIGAGIANPLAKALASCTMAAAATQWFGSGLTSGLVTSAAGPAACKIQYDGEVILAPGTLISLQGDVAQSNNLNPTVAWAEWPI